METTSDGEVAIYRQSNGRWAARFGHRTADGKRRRLVWYATSRQALEPITEVALAILAQQKGDQANGEER